VRSTSACALAALALLVAGLGEVPRAARAEEPRDVVSDLLPAAPKAPAFKSRTLEGKSLELAALLAKGPVVLDFWATWCKPCLQALPEIQRVQDRWAARGVTMVGISEDGPRNLAKVRPFASRYKLTYPLIVDEDGSLQSAYQVRSLPTTFVIDRRGRVVWVHQGYRPGMETMLDEALEAVFADSTTEGGE
jgi:peroxiredoxin